MTPNYWHGTTFKTHHLQTIGTTFKLLAPPSKHITFKLQPFSYVVFSWPDGSLTDQNWGPCYSLSEPLLIWQMKQETSHDYIISCEQVDISNSWEPQFMTIKSDTGQRLQSGDNFEVDDDVWQDSGGKWAGLKVWWVIWGRGGARRPSCNLVPRMPSGLKLLSGWAHPWWWSCQHIWPSDLFSEISIWPGRFLHDKSYQRFLNANLKFWVGSLLIP